MRPIKFRVWNAKRKEMVVGMPLPMLAGWITAKYPNLDDEIYIQFTGLLDKNGKEIYEGDILAYSQMGLQKDVFGDIRFHEGSFVIWMGKELKASVDTYDPYISIGNCIVYEVIGNIHENPELLK